MATQLGNTTNASIPATGAVATVQPLSVPVEDGPVKRLDPMTLGNLAAKYKSLFSRFASERIPAEQRWLRNLRQYMGIYDPAIEQQLPPNRSRAYPRLTRMKCVSMLSRLMNLMFPGNEDNWELTASPSPSMSPEMVQQAVEELIAERQQDGGEAPPITQELLETAVMRLAEKQAAKLALVIKDQLRELGGDQSTDWIALNRKVADSAIKYGVGVLEGPYVRKVEVSGWGVAENGQFVPTVKVLYKPHYEFLPVWDFYPDMSARTLPGEGYFVRKVLGRAALRKLSDRPDFLKSQIEQAIRMIPGGNYKAKSWENDLRTMGLAVHSETTSNQASGRERYEIIIWKGPVSAQTLRDAGADVPERFLADDVDAELWMVDNWIIKAEVNAWRKLDMAMRTAHVFNFDEDDTSPIGQGLPQIVRDSQLSICAATRMTLDNASVTCGPNLEVNTALMRADQDLSSVEAYKIWYRDDTDMATAQYPAVRPVAVDGHLNELQALIKMFLEFAEMETFIGPVTGGDMQRMPSEPMRTAAGASMLRGDAALPFKDIVRNFDSFTQSVLWSLVTFNRKFNPNEAPEGDYTVIPRGATSLIAKEVRGAQIDMLSQTLTPDERDHIDERKFVEAKFASRDLQGMLVPPDVADQRKASRAQMAAEAEERQKQLHEATVREMAADAFKSITQGQKNAATADATQVKAATDIITGMTDDEPAATSTGGGTGGAAAKGGAAGRSGS